MKTLKNLLLASAFVAAGSLSAQAADLLTPTEAQVDESRFDVSFGVTLASEYMFRGITQTDNDPAIQGYIEASYSLVYVGIWASNLDFNTPDPDVEIDFYGGIRPTFGPVDFDFGVVRYQYPDAAALNFTELYAKASFSPVEKLGLGAALFYSPDISDEDSLYVEANASYELPYNFSVSGAVGHQMFDNAIGATDYTTWNAGISYAPTDWATFDVRYHDTDLAGNDARVVASLSLSSSYQSLKKAMAK